MRWRRPRARVPRREAERPPRTAELRTGSNLHRPVPEQSYPPGMNPTLHLHLVAAAPADAGPDPYVYLITGATVSVITVIATGVATRPRRPGRPYGEAVRAAEGEVPAARALVVGARVRLQVLAPELADRAKAAYAMRHAPDAEELSERRVSARQAAEDLVDAAASLFVRGR